jgi:hypothetical protein
MTYFSFLSSDSTPADVWALKTGLEKHWPVLPNNIMAADSALTKDQRAFIAAFYAGLYVKSRYNGEALDKQAIQAVLGSDVNFDEDLLAKALEDPKTADLDKRLLPIFLFVKKLCLESYKLMQRDADAIYAQDWPESTLSDVCFVCAAMSFYLSVMKDHGLTL